MSSRFSVSSTPLSELKLIQRKPLGDSRGYLERLFCMEELHSLLPGGKGIVQINHTLTSKSGTVRGMHFQYPPHSEAKFVSCLRGEVFDVAVDLRRNSPTFLHWHAEFLNDTTHKTLLVPEGFAHGFQALTEGAEVLYFTTAAYQPAAEGGLSPSDPRLAIEWPRAVTDLSARDASHPSLDNEFNGVAV